MGGGREDLVAVRLGEALVLQQAEQQDRPRDDRRRVVGRRWSFAERRPDQRLGQRRVDVEPGGVVAFPGGRHEPDHRRALLPGDEPPPHRHQQSPGEQVRVPPPVRLGEPPQPPFVAAQPPGQQGAQRRVRIGHHRRSLLILSRARRVLRCARRQSRKPFWCCEPRGGCRASTGCAFSPPTVGINV
ncbi:hypothetical protein [Micromonospora sp. 067-2]|uniref:hypothetical protein n=1 Tax=Micromonospora sp. 067-2 TaxID=2789270 RepID=UPI003979F917